MTSARHRPSLSRFNRLSAPAAPAQGRHEQTLHERVCGPAVPLYARHAPTLPPDEAVPGEPEAWEAVQPVRPDTPHVRALRFLNATGELLAAFVLIGGGMGLIGFVSHL